MFLEESEEVNKLLPLYGKESLCITYGKEC